VNLYQIYAPTRGYDVYREALVLAPDEETARNLHPNGTDVWDGRSWCDPDFIPVSMGFMRREISNHSWVAPSEVTVTLVGVAVPDLGDRPRVLLASFFSG
jgi:hypothetical protein